MIDNNKAIWPGWRTVKLIGRGSFGAVYEIERDNFGEVEKAALKVISIPQNEGEIEELYNEGHDDDSITSTFENHLKSITDEYSLMKKMSGSAYVVNCEDMRYVHHDDGIGWDVFIKMELLTPLIKALPDKIEEETVIKIAKDMCGALVLCKKHNIIHRDIKPQNIFVSQYGNYKLGDFGIAKAVEKTMGGTKIGTYKYMAPEVYNNQPYGSAADIYSLGLVLYWLLNERRLPFLPLPPKKLNLADEEIARRRRFTGEEIPSPLNGSEELKQIILKACAFDPKDRYASAAEMLEDLNSIGKKDVIDVINVEPEYDTIPVIENPEFETSTDKKEKDVEVKVHIEEKISEIIEEPAENKQEKKNEEKAVIDNKTSEIHKSNKQNKAKLTNKGKKIGILSVALVVILSCVVVVGCYMLLGKSTGFKTIEGKTYYYENGEVKTGWQTVNGNNYRLDENGVVQTGWQEIDGKKYYFNENGVMQTGWQTINGNKYCFYGNGVMRTGWQTIDGKTYCFYGNGEMKTGWQYIDSKKYYFNENGVMQTGWQTVNGKTYCFYGNGEMRTGFKTIDGNTYYFDESGIMQTGWQTIKGKKYCFYGNGVMRTGWQTIDGKTYNFYGNGEMRTGFKTIDGQTYYFDKNGVMQTGWQTISGKTYCFYENGVMRVGFKTIDGKTYYFNENGEMQIGWQTIKGKKYCFYGNGVMRTGWQSIDGKKYYFDKNGVLTDS